MKYILSLIQILLAHMIYVDFYLEPTFLGYDRLARGQCTPPLFRECVRGGGHCALNRVLRGHFPRNQDATVKLKSELISSKF